MFFVSSCIEFTNKISSAFCTKWKRNAMYFHRYSIIEMPLHTLSCTLVRITIMVSYLIRYVFIFFALHFTNMQYALRNECVLICFVLFCFALICRCVYTFRSQNQMNNKILLNSFTRSMLFLCSAFSVFALVSVLVSYWFHFTWNLPSTSSKIDEISTQKHNDNYFRYHSFGGGYFIFHFHFFRQFKFINV